MSWSLKEALRQRREQEENTCAPPQAGGRGFALVYPNNYQVGMSNLGLHILYRLLNERGDLCCERAFLPEKKAWDEHIRTQTPLMTVESQRPLSAFALVGFALSFEMDYFHFLDMLQLGRIPQLAVERGEQDPFVLIGGPCATFNPEPLAPFVDAAIIGEGEEVLQELVDVYQDCRTKGKTRQEVLLAWAHIPGVYVPAFYEANYEADGRVTAWRKLGKVPETISRRRVERLDDYPGETAVFAEDAEFGKLFLLEVARGCGRHCRFCMAGYCFRQPRPRSLSVLRQALLRAQQQGMKVGLMGAAVSDYPEIQALCHEFEAKGMRFSVASLRADSLDAVLVAGLAASGHRTLTLAPEAGSQRLRDVINKGIREEHLLEGVHLAAQAGIPNLRLYIMIGLPTEVDEDIDAIAEMALRVLACMEEAGSKGKLTLSVNPFIPKPFTPFQWLPMADKKVVQQRLRRLESLLKSQRRIEILSEPPREAYVQAVLARGDRRLAPVLAAAAAKGGWRRFTACLKDAGLDEESYLYRQRSLDERLPWAHLDMGFNKDYLWQEWQRAVKEAPTKGCFPGCRRCGICKEGREAW